jgi:GcrA cell cycle regulator
MDWNEERTATLRKLWLEGMSASQVARQLGGVSRSAVIGKVHRLGITVRDIPYPSAHHGAHRGSSSTPARVVRDAAPARVPPSPDRDRRDGADREHPGP